MKSLWVILSHIFSLTYIPTYICFSPFVIMSTFCNPGIVKSLFKIVDEMNKYVPEVEKVGDAEVPKGK